MKLSKEFWVSDYDLKKLTNYDGMEILLRSEDESNNKDVPIARQAVNKIIITYEIDREVTIKESDFERYLQEWDLNTPSIRVTDYLKQRIFGGGENE